MWDVNYEILRISFYNKITFILKWWVLKQGHFLSKFLIVFSYLLQVQDLGLQQSYRDDCVTHDFICRVMALPFFPEDEIVPQFERLESQVTEDGSLKQLIQYFRSTWIEGSRWEPSTWTIFLQSVERTTA